MSARKPYVETLIGAAEQPWSQDCVGMDIKGDKEGHYIEMVFLDPDKVAVPATYDDMRIKKVKPEVTRTITAPTGNATGSRESRGSRSTQSAEDTHVRRPTYRYVGPSRD